MAEQPVSAPPTPEPPGAPGLPRRRLIITMAGVMLAMFLASLDNTIVGTAMPRIIADLGGFTKYTWVATAYIIASTIAVPITGKLTDMYGRKWFYVAGLCIFIVGSILCGFSQTMNQIIGFRALQGIGAGIMMANAFIAVGDLFPPSERGKYQGLVAGVFGLSSVIGPTLGGFITDSLSWNWVFFINIPLGLLIVALFVLFFPNVRPEGVKPRLDYLGVMALILTVIPAMLALTQGGVDYPWLSARILGMFAFSAVMGGLFILAEMRAPEPIMPLWIFRDRIVAVALIVIFITGFGMFGAIIYIPLYFQGVLGMSATASGSFLTPMMLGVVVGSIISGQILSRAGGHYRVQGVFGLAMMAAGMGLMSTMTAETSYPTAVAYIVLLGFGLGNTMPLYVIAVQNAVPYSVLGIATSSTAFFRQIGGALGLAVLGSAVTNRFGSEFLSELSPQVREVTPPQLLDELAQNPQALMSPEAQSDLRDFFEQFGQQGAVFFEHVLNVLQSALSSAIAEAFLIGFLVIIAAWVVNWFIREIPLRTER